MEEYVCQLGEGFMLKRIDGSEGAYYIMEETGYPYPDTRLSNIEALCEVFGYSIGSKGYEYVNANPKRYMDKLVNIITSSKNKSVRDEDLKKPDGSDIYVLCTVDEWMLLYVDSNEDWCESVGINVCYRDDRRRRSVILVYELNSILDGIKLKRSRIKKYYGFETVFFELCKLGEDAVYCFPCKEIDEKDVVFKFTTSEANFYVLGVFICACVQEKFPNIKADELLNTSVIVDFIGNMNMDMQSVYGMNKDTIFHIMQVELKRLCFPSYINTELVHGRNIKRISGSKRFAVWEDTLGLLEYAELDESDRLKNNWLYSMALENRGSGYLRFDLMLLCGNELLLDVVWDYVKHQREFINHYRRVNKSSVKRGKQMMSAYCSEGDYKALEAKVAMLDAGNTWHVIKGAWAYTCYSVHISPVLNYLFMSASDDMISTSFGINGCVCVKMYPFLFLSNIIIAGIDIEMLCKDLMLDFVKLALSVLLSVSPKELSLYLPSGNLGEDRWDIDFEFPQDKETTCVMVTYS